MSWVYNIPLFADKIARVHGLLFRTLKERPKSRTMRILVLTLLFSHLLYAYDSIETHIGSCETPVKVFVESPPSYQRGRIVITEFNTFELYQYKSDVKKVEENFADKLEKYVSLTWWKEGQFVSGQCGNFIKVRVNSQDSGWTTYKEVGFIPIKEVVHSKKCLEEQFPKDIINYYLHECSNPVGENKKEASYEDFSRAPAGRFEQKQKFLPKN